MCFMVGTIYCGVCDLVLEGSAPMGPLSFHPPEQAPPSSLVNSRANMDYRHDFPARPSAGSRTPFPSSRNMVKVEDVEGGRGLLGGGTEPVYGRRGNRHRKVPSNTYGGQLPFFR